MSIAEGMVLWSIQYFHAYAGEGYGKWDVPNRKVELGSDGMVKYVVQTR